MLTLILLVVLGGGAGLLAVSLSDHRAPWTALRERRDPPSLGPDPEDRSATDPDPSASHDQNRPFLVEFGRVNGEGAPSRTYRRAASIPRSRIALEGTYTEVAVAPWWRRLLSLTLIVGIVGIAGVTIAIVLGVTLTAVAQVLDRAIG